MVCSETFKLSTAGKSALTEHSDGRKHKELRHKTHLFLERRGELQLNFAAAKPQGETSKSNVSGGGSVSKRQQSKIMKRDNTADPYQMVVEDGDE